MQRHRFTNVIAGKMHGNLLPVHRALWFSVSFCRCHPDDPHSTCARHAGQVEMGMCFGQLGQSKPPNINRVLFNSLRVWFQCLKKMVPT